MTEQQQQRKVTEHEEKIQHAKQEVPGQEHKEETHEEKERQERRKKHHEKYECTEPCYTLDWYKGSEKLKDYVALITGGKTGIGRAVAILFAREGANVAITYKKHDEEANKTKELIEKEGRKCLLICGDVSQKHFCEEAVKKTVDEFKQLDILVNAAFVRAKQENVENISEQQLEHTFRTNIFSMFFMVQASLEYLRKSHHASIINTSSSTGYLGHPSLLDYAASKGGIISYTKALSQNLAKDNIRVNAVAPGVIRSPRVKKLFKEEEIKHHSQKTVLQRAGHPEEVSPAYVFLASPESSYVTGKILEIDGGLKSI